MKNNEIMSRMALGGWVVFVFCASVGMVCNCSFNIQ